MATPLNTSTNLIDSAIGPLAVTDVDYDDFDVDDFAHMMARSQAIELEIQNKARTADPDQAKNRTPITTDDGYVVGGF